MIPDWQTIAVVLCVAFAAVVLVRRGIALFRGKPGGGCGSCPSKSPDAGGSPSKPFVSLDQLSASEKPKG
jgi:hypothetical protein